MTPIVVFAYNRAEILERSLKFLLESDNLHKHKIYFFVDGYKNEFDKAKVNKVLELIKTFNFNNKEIIFSKVNKGLKTSVKLGLDFIFEKYHKAIILEDDICVSKDFLNFHNDFLEKYENNSKIWSISGYTIPNFFIKFFKCEYFMVQRASSWGWSTWRSRWQKVNWEQNLLLEELNKKFLKYHFTSGDKIRMLVREFNGESSSWAIIWDFNQFLNNSFTIYPKKSLVDNIGFDGSGVHSKEGYYNKFKNDISIRYYTNKRLNFDVKQNFFISLLYYLMSLKIYRLPLDFIRLILLILKYKNKLLKLHR